jgi:hypothetical protein
MKNIEEKESNLWWRKQWLEIIKFSIKMYEKTNDKRFYEYAKTFGKEAKRFDIRGNYKESIY